MKFELNEENTGGVPLKSWIDSQELYESDSLFKQSTDIARLPHAFSHVALMPDAHGGYGMPIGGVLALEGHLCPSAVGYDIGCGMLAFKTDIPVADFKPHRVAVSRTVRALIPIGEGGNRSEISEYAQIPEVPDEAAVFVHDRVDRNIEIQCGTLGGGNHFIEFDRGSDDTVWCVIHSGSRGVGHAIAGYYMKLAETYCAAMYQGVPKDLAFLPVDSVEGENYRVALKWALDWALENRLVMAAHIQDALSETFCGFSFGAPINVHHNDANLEEHFGRQVWVHRKGATRAAVGDRLVIPGNMGQGTVICTGLGNPDSFSSSSHGAGRRLGRNQAKRTLDLETERAKLAKLDVIVSAGRDGALDEMPAAYKDFDRIMEAQSDLVTVTDRLYPLSVLKG